ncbi:MAG: hypothetical protein JWO58_1949 [Chitinophagaceae bacterium]|nr:hypothetical protein [Chitinophagaceae bacterium]
MNLLFHQTRVFLFPGSLAGSSWKEAWQSFSFRVQVTATVCVGLLLVIVVPYFFNYIQTVQGHYLHDVVLSYLPAKNMSWSIFILLYGMIILALTNLFFQPVLLLKGVQAYIVLTVMRACCIYFYPLEPDKNIIPLTDPFVNMFFYSRLLITKDLFFSGHVSFLFLLYFVLPFPFLKKIALVAALLVALFILLQHVHYTIDVLVAPLAAYIAYCSVTVINRDV